MIRSGFLDGESRQDLIELARDGSAPHRLARRANALVLLDDGMSCEAVAKVLLLDDDTIRSWYRLYQEDGIEGLANFGYDGAACRLTEAQQERLKAWVSETLPRTTREVGAFIAQEFGIEYQGRSGLIMLLHRLGMEHRKPKAISRQLDPAKQAAFIKRYEALMNQLEADEAVMFADAVHPTHAVRPVGCWAPKDMPVAITQTSGRHRLNIHGAINLETGNTRMLEVVTVNAISTIMLLRGDRGDVSGETADPRIPRQRPVSPCQSCEAVAGSARVPHQAAFHPGLLPASRCHRATVGVDAPACHAQQVLRGLCRVQSGGPRLPA